MPTNQLIYRLFKDCARTDENDLCDYKAEATKLQSNATNDHQYPYAHAGPGIKSAAWKLIMALLVKGNKRCFDVLILRGITLKDIVLGILTVFTFGIKIPAGLFIPSMAVGAIFGRLLGIALQQLAYNNPEVYPFSEYCTAAADCITPGFYAMVGAAAVLAGVTRMTVSLVVIMFELTGASIEYQW